MGCMYRLCQNYGTATRSAVFVFYEYEDDQVVTAQLDSLYGEHRHWHSVCWMLMRMMEWSMQYEKRTHSQHTRA